MEWFCQVITRNKKTQIIYQIASTNGAEAIDNVDEYEAGFDVFRQRERLLFDGDLLSEKLHSVGRNHVSETVLFESRFLMRFTELIFF